MAVTPPGGREQPPTAKSVSESHLARQVLSTGPELVADVLEGLPWYAMIPLIGPYFAKRAACNKVKEEIIQVNNNAEDPYDKEQLKKFLSGLSIDHLVLFKHLITTPSLKESLSSLPPLFPKLVSLAQKMAPTNSYTDRLHAIKTHLPHILETTHSNRPEELNQNLSALEHMFTFFSDLSRTLGTMNDADKQAFVTQWMTLPKDAVQKETEMFMKGITLAQEVQAHPNRPDSISKVDEIMAMATQLPSISSGIKLMMRSMRGLADTFGIINTQICEYNIQGMYESTDRTQSYAHQRLPDTPFSILEEQHPPLNLSEFAENEIIDMTDRTTEISLTDPNTMETRALRVSLPFEGEMNVGNLKHKMEELVEYISSPERVENPPPTFVAFVENYERAFNEARSDFSTTQRFAYAKMMPAYTEEAVKNKSFHAASLGNVFSLKDSTLSLLPPDVARRADIMSHLPPEAVEALSSSLKGESRAGNATCTFQPKKGASEKFKFIVKERPLEGDFSTGYVGLTIEVTSIDKTIERPTMYLAESIDEVVDSKLFERDLLLTLGKVYETRAQFNPQEFVECLSSLTPAQKEIFQANRSRLADIMRIQTDESSQLTLSETFAAFLKVHEPLSQIEKEFVSLLPTYQPVHFNRFILGWIMIANTTDGERLNAAFTTLDEYIDMVRDNHTNWENQTDQNYIDLAFKTAEFQTVCINATPHLNSLFEPLSDHVCYGAIQIGDENIRTLDPKLQKSERSWNTTMPQTRVPSPFSLWQQNQPLGALLDRAENNMVNLHGLSTEFHIIRPETGESRCVCVPLPFENRPISVEEAQGAVEKLYKQLEAGSGNPKDNAAYHTFATDVEYAGRAALNDFFADTYFDYAKTNLPQNPRDAIAQYNVYGLDTGRLSLLPQEIDPKGLTTSLSPENLQTLKRDKEVVFTDLGLVTVSFQADTDHPNRRKMLTTVNGVTRTSYHDARKTDDEIQASPFFERDILLGIAHYYAEGNG